MKFVVVNHEPPSREADVQHLLAVDPDPATYRHGRTQRRYCDYDCYHRNEFVTLMMEWSVPGLTATHATENIVVAARNAGAVSVLGAVSR